LVAAGHRRHGGAQRERLVGRALRADARCYERARPLHVPKSGCQRRDGPDRTGSDHDAGAECNRPCSNCDPDIDCDHGAERHTHPDRDAERNPDRDGERYSDHDADTNGDDNPDAERHPDPDADRHADPDANAERHRDGNADVLTGPDANADADDNPDPDADAARGNTGA